MSSDFRHYDILRRPIVTEKSTVLSAHNAHVFEVAIAADKPAVRAAVETVFGVKVKSVNTSIRKGKTKRWRGRRGRRRDVKLAVVTLEEGHSIDLAPSGSS